MQHVVDKAVLFDAIWCLYDPVKANRKIDGDSTRGHDRCKRILECLKRKKLYTKLYPRTVSTQFCLDEIVKIGVYAPNAVKELIANIEDHRKDLANLKHKKALDRFRKVCAERMRHIREEMKLALEVARYEHMKKHNNPNLVVGKEWKEKAIAAIKVEIQQNNTRYIDELSERNMPIKQAGEVARAHHIVELTKRLSELKTWYEMHTNKSSAKPSASKLAALQNKYK